MATSPVVIDPATGERVQSSAPQIDPATGERVAAQASPPQEGFWESLGHTFGIGKEEAAARAKDVQEHPLVTALKAAIPGWEAVQGAIQGGKRIAGEETQRDRAIAQGDLGSAVVHGVQALPFVGPAIQHGAEQLNPGESINPAEFGTALGTAMQTAPMVLGAADSAFPSRPALPNPLASAGNAIVGKLSAPLGEMVVKPRGTVPAESASPAELKAYADENQIPLNAAQATEHNLPRNLQTAGERATFGGTAVKQQTKAGQAAVVGHAHDLMNSFSPNTFDMTTAGEKIQQSVSAALDQEKQAAEQAYAAIDNSANGVKVDLKPLKNEAASLLKDSSFIRQNVSSLDPKRASTVVGSFQNLPDTATFTQAQQLRSALLDEARHPDVVISQLGQGWIKRLSGLTDRQMEAAARSSSPELMSKFRAANAQWEGMQEAFNNPKSPLYQTLQEADPNKVPQKFLSKGQIGGSPYNAELLDRYGIDKGPIKWALMGDMANKDFGLYQGGKRLGGYSDDFLASMFEPAELETIYKTGAIARSLKLNTNPSGTAGAESALADVGHPLNPATYLKGGAAFLTNRDFFNNWLMNNPPPPSSDLVAFHNWRTRQFNALTGGAEALAAENGANRENKKE